MEILEKLFGSIAKVKIIKLFILNKEEVYDVVTVADRTKVSLSIARKEIKNLEKISFIKTKIFSKEIKRQKNRRIMSVRKKTNGWILDPKFPYLESLEIFLASMPLRYTDIANKISKVGKIQLLVVSGLFIKDQDSRVDLLVVGDNLKENMLDNIIHNIESEIGKEIRYTSFETAEFNYRYSVFDKLVRDILDFPHEKIINKFNF